MSGLECQDPPRGGGSQRRDTRPAGHVLRHGVRKPHGTCADDISESTVGFPQ